MSDFIIKIRKTNKPVNVCIITILRRVGMRKNWEATNWKKMKENILYLSQRLD